MTMTNRGRRTLEAYLDRVRTSLSGRDDVEVTDVIEGIEEHVDAELAARGAEPATAEDVAEILERLGAPDAWAAEFGPERPGRARATAAGPTPEPRSGTTAAPTSDPASGGRAGSRHLVPLILGGAGAGLVTVEAAPILGWALLAVGAISARVVISLEGDDVGRRSLPERWVRIYWQGACLVTGLALVLIPLVLVWGQSQRGGVLEPLLLERTVPGGRFFGSFGGDGSGTAPGGRPSGYWPLVGILAAGVAGAWWLSLATGIRATRARLRGALAPARWPTSAGTTRLLTVAGAFSLVLALVLGGLSWLL